jgi:hypothetical protein
MSFETTSLLLNWTQLGVSLAILFRLHHIFDLIANTQRELRRAIHRLSDRRDAEPSLNDAGAGPGRALVSSTASARGPQSVVGADEGGYLPF